MRNKFLCKICLIIALVFAFSTSAFAKSNEVVLEDNRTLTPTGNAQLLDNVTDNENLQFITVTARDGNVFYFVIDHGAESENVYFLNVVDEADLNALIEKEETEVLEESAPETEKPDELVPIEDVEPEEPEGNNTGLIIILIIAVAAGIGGYYYKVILPKKKLKEADDIEDFDFGDEDDDLDEDVKEAEEVYDTDEDEETE